MSPASCSEALDRFLASAEGQGWARHVPQFRSLAEAACRRVDLAGGTLAPPPNTIFSAFSLTPADSVRVVVLGQDPYPTPGHANGLAFSHRGNPPLPRSLLNIFRELAADQGLVHSSGDLSGWAAEGVLLLNTALTVAEGAGGAGSHLKLGWQALTDAVISAISQSPRPVAFVLWGNPAQEKRRLIDDARHLVVASAHPSPLSARRGFFGSRPFGQINDWLIRQGEPPIDWGRINGR